jgi:hypothetical protein
MTHVNDQAATVRPCPLCQLGQYPTLEGDSDDTSSMCSFLPPTVAAALKTSPDAVTKCDESGAQQCVLSRLTEGCAWKKDALGLLDTTSSGMCESDAGCEDDTSVDGLPCHAIPFDDPWHAPGCESSSVGRQKFVPWSQRTADTTKRFQSGEFEWVVKPAIGCVLVRKMKACLATHRCLDLEGKVAAAVDVYFANIGVAPTCSGLSSDVKQLLRGEAPPLRHCMDPAEANKNAKYGDFVPFW